MNRLANNYGLIDRLERAAKGHLLSGDDMATLAKDAVLAIQKLERDVIRASSRRPTGPVFKRVAR